MRYMISLFLLLSTVSWAQTSTPVAGKWKVEDFTKSQPQPVSATGRYQIFFSPSGARADTFLVDTSTGRTWRIAYRSVGTTIEPSAWVIQDRLDSPEELKAWEDLQERKAALVKALETPSH